MFQQGFNGFLRIVVEYFTLITWRLCNQSTGLKSIWFPGILLKRTESSPTVTELHCIRETCSSTWYMLPITHSSLHTDQWHSGRCNKTTAMPIHRISKRPDYPYVHNIFPRLKNHLVALSKAALPLELFIQPWALVPYRWRIRRKLRAT